MLLTVNKKAQVNNLNPSIKKSLSFIKKLYPVLTDYLFENWKRALAPF